MSLQPTTGELSRTLTAAITAKAQQTRSYAYISLTVAGVMIMLLLCYLFYGQRIIPTAILHRLPQTPIWVFGSSVVVFMLLAAYSMFQLAKEFLRGIQVAASAPPLAVSLLAYKRWYRGKSSYILLELRDPTAPDTLFFTIRVISAMTVEQAKTFSHTSATAFMVADTREPVVIHSAGDTIIGERSTSEEMKKGYYLTPL